jgi:hypothetical protein
MKRRTACRGGTRTNMKHISELKPTMARTRPNTNAMTNAMPRASQAARRNKPSAGPRRSQAGTAQDAERNYQRYLALAQAEALTGDRITAENYFQHAEHYFRSVQAADAAVARKQSVG